MLNRVMRIHKVSFLASVMAFLFTACNSAEMSYIDEVADIPLKWAGYPSTAWAEAPLRANAAYLLYGAESAKERQRRVGDYYYVRWYDAEPEKPAKLVMRYTQALTASEEQRQEQEIEAPRDGRGIRLHRFEFNGPERAKRGDVLSWRVELYVDGQLRDAHKSYLWQDK